MNVNYKILTKIIAKTIEKVLPKIMNPNQTGYVKGRFIGENIRLIQDVMSLTKNANMPGIAIFLDFAKPLTQLHGTTYYPHSDFLILDPIFKNG